MLLKFVDWPCLLITCFIFETYVLQNSRPGIAHEVGKTNHCNDSKKAVNAYGVQDTLNNAIMMITILVNLFCLFATISAILPVDSIVCYNIILYLFGHLAIFIRAFFAIQSFTAVIDELLKWCCLQFYNLVETLQLYLF